MASKIYLFPGQGSQKKGMGTDVFPLFPVETAAADSILGYAVAEQCIEDPGGRLSQTQFTQPLLFTVCSLMYLKQVQESGRRPDMVAGHSVGEFAALFAAGVFDFETGLKIVKKRGELMSRASGGGMAAVVGMSVDQIRAVLEGGGTRRSPSRISTRRSSPCSRARKTTCWRCGKHSKRPAPGCSCRSTSVPPSIHATCSRRRRVRKVRSRLSFSPPSIPVISNVTARPYEPSAIVENMTRQITSPVRWVESVQYLLQQPEPAFEEVGPGVVLTSLLRQIKAAPR